jgi:hypothetical protein
MIDLIYHNVIFDFEFSIDDNGIGATRNSSEISTGLMKHLLMIMIHI